MPPIRTEAWERQYGKGWHSRNWLKQNYGVDPAYLPVPYEEGWNPWWNVKMRLWKESTVKPFARSLDQTQAKRKTDKTHYTNSPFYTYLLFVGSVDFRLGEDLRV
jgi:hypothetical protein